MTTAHPGGRPDRPNKGPRCSREAARRVEDWLRGGRNLRFAHVPPTYLRSDSAPLIRPIAAHMQPRRFPGYLGWRLRQSSQSIVDRVLLFLDFNLHFPPRCLSVPGRLVSNPAPSPLSPKRRSRHAPPSHMAALPPSATDSRLRTTLRRLPVRPRCCPEPTDPAPCPEANCSMPSSAHIPPP